MKWLGLFISVAAIMPLSWWLRRNPRETPKFWMLMGFLPFALEPFHAYMALVSWPEWPGYVKGIEFSVLDALALALYFSSPGGQRPLPFQLPMALYFLAVLLATFQASVPEAALFYPWQLCRMFLVYAVVTRGCADPRVPPALLRGMGAAIFMEAGVTIWQRFGLHELQAHGTLDHQNFLGMMSHFVVLPFFALLLAVRRGWLNPAVLLGGVTVELLTTSRATVGLAVVGYTAIFIISALRRWTARKALLLFSSIAVAIIILPLAVWSFDTRFATSEPSNPDYDERAAFETAATMMIADHLLGVGANQYVLAANVDGYNNRAGVIPVVGSDSTNVHNVYLLVTAESGPLGLITFLFLLLRPLIVAFRCSWHNRGDLRGDLLLGIGVALLAVYIHSFFEWVFITFPFQYMFALQLGLVAGVAEQLGYWRRGKPVRLGTLDALSVRPG